MKISKTIRKLWAKKDESCYISMRLELQLSLKSAIRVQILDNAIYVLLHANAI